MRIRFIKDTFNIKNNGFYSAGAVYDLPEAEAQDYVKKERAEAVFDTPLMAQRELARKAFEQLRADEAQAKLDIELKKLFAALEIRPERNKRLVLPVISDGEINNLKKYFASKKHISADVLANLILKIYIYAKDNKDNRTLEKASTDLLTLYRLTKFYDEK